ncbi:MAG: accessory gene regulator B family protein [Lachnospiraceae bacterium]|nr:accessory gene regulator B family protein [Lachnospiraceae bacterium]
MFEKAVQKLVDGQIEKGSLKEEDRNIYRYGYQVLIEFCINIIVTILIAVLFQAFKTVIVFTIAYLLIRGYVGGYHAKTSLGCFCLSAGMLISVILVIQYINSMNPLKWILLIPEIVLIPFIFRQAPLPVANKPISENERIHFKRRVKQLYSIELMTTVILLYFGEVSCALSILAVHVVLFVMVLVQMFSNWKAGRTVE